MEVETIHTQKRIRFNVDLFKQYRIDNNLTQKQYADILETATNVVSYWETEKRTPLPGTIDKISRITGIPLTDLYIINHETLGTKLTTMRLSQGIQQKEFAEQIGTSPENINRWEADKHIPSAYFVYRLSKELGVTMEELLTNENGGLIISDPHNQN